MLRQWNRSGLVALTCLLIISQGCHRKPGSESAESGLPPSPSLSDAYCSAQAAAGKPAKEAAASSNGYGIFAATVENLPGYLGYLKHAREILPAYQGRAVMWGPNMMNVLEGEAPNYYFMVLEFPNMGLFNGFYCSPEYHSKVIKERFDATTVVLSVAKEGDASSTAVLSTSTAEHVKAFALFNDVVTDKDAYQRYLDAATELAKLSGGIRLVSGAKHSMIEGKAENKPDNLTLFSFPSMDKLKEWYESPAYQELKADRLKASTVRFVLAKNGLAP